jgi:hypothetical protein
MTALQTTLMFPLYYRHTTKVFSLIRIGLEPYLLDYCVVDFVIVLIVVVVVVVAGMVVVVVLVDVGDMYYHRLAEAFNHIFAMRLSLADPSFVNTTRSVSQSVSESVSQSVTNHPPTYLPFSFAIIYNL